MELPNIEHPEYLENLYRKNSSEFDQQFSRLSASSPEHPLVKFWNTRLSYDQQPTIWFSKSDINHILATLLIFGALATLPSWMKYSESEMGFYYLRYAGFLAFPTMIFYFFRNLQTPLKVRWIVTGISVVLLLFISLLPGGTEPSDTLLLAGLHLPVILWGLLGYVYDRQNHFNYLRFNGDLVVATGILSLAWMLMSGITVGLFGLIEINIGDFYPKYVVVAGFSAIPVTALITVNRSNGFVNQVSPWIARIFSPLALVVLSVFLIFFLFSGNDIFTNRDFLIMFNAILVAVLALILFSLSSAEHKWLNWVLLGLSVVTIVVNITALSAIIYRLSDFGATPNRIAVLGANILFLLHLIVVTNNLRKVVLSGESKSSVLESVGKFLPAYLVWCAVVVLLFPLIFSFR